MPRPLILTVLIAAVLAHALLCGVGCLDGAAVEAVPAGPATSSCTHCVPASSRIAADLTACRLYAPPAPIHTDHTCLCPFQLMPRLDSTDESARARLRLLTPAIAASRLSVFHPPAWPFVQSASHPPGGPPGSSAFACLHLATVRLLC